MSMKDLLARIREGSIDSDYMLKIEDFYGVKINEEVSAILSAGKNESFIDDLRVIKDKEIINAVDFMGVDFRKNGLIPLIDMKDNDFLVYSINDKKYYLYNIVDEVLYDGNDSIDKYAF